MNELKRVALIAGLGLAQLSLAADSEGLSSQAGTAGLLKGILSELLAERAQDLNSAAVKPDIIATGTVELADGDLPKLDKWLETRDEYGIADLRRICDFNKLIGGDNEVLVTTYIVKVGEAGPETKSGSFLAYRKDATLRRIDVLKSPYPFLLNLVLVPADFDQVAIKVGATIKENERPELRMLQEALSVLSAGGIKSIGGASIKSVGTNPPKLPRLYAQLSRITTPIPPFATFQAKSSLMAVNSGEFDAVKTRFEMNKTTVASLTKTLEQNSLAPVITQEIARVELAAKSLALTQAQLDAATKICASLKKEMEDLPVKASQSAPALDRQDKLHLSFSLATAVGKGFKDVRYDDGKKTLVSDNADNPVYVTADFHPLGYFYQDTWANKDDRDNGFSRYADIALFAGTRADESKFSPVIGGSVGLHFRRLGLGLWYGSARMSELDEGGGKADKWNEQYGLYVRCQMK